MQLFLGFAWLWTFGTVSLGSRKGLSQPSLYFAQLDLSVLVSLAMIDSKGHDILEFPSDMDACVAELLGTLVFHYLY